jgi:hypothetical protein
LVRAVADQFHPKDSEVRVLHVLQPATLSEPPEMAAGYPLHTEEDASPQCRKSIGLRSVGGRRGGRWPERLHSERFWLVSKLFGSEHRRLASESLGADSHSLGGTISWVDHRVNLHHTRESL